VSAPGSWDGGVGLFYPNQFSDYTTGCLCSSLSISSTYSSPCFSVMPCSLVDVE
jgi:hypothetical protein